MRRYILIIILLFLLIPSVFGEEEIVEEYILVQLEDGSYETRSTTEFLPEPEIGLRMASVNLDVDQAITNAVLKDDIIYAEKVYPLRLTVSPNSSNDAWRFEEIDIDGILNTIKADLSDTTVRVAVVDSGLNLQLATTDLNVADAVDVSEVNDFDVTDFSGHGSHVAGIIGSRIDDGDNDIDGIAPGVTIIPVKVFKDNGSGNTGMLVDAFEYLLALPADKQPDVINMSLSYGSYTKAVHDQIKLANDEGIIIVAATSNDSNLWITGDDYNDVSVKNNSQTQSYQSVAFPAAHTEVIAVGSVTKHSSENKVGISDFSNIAGNQVGESGTFKAEVDVVAPGATIASWIEINGETAYKSGTSMASPHVAGLFALLKDKYPLMSASDMKALVKAMAFGDDIEIPSGHTLTDVVGSGLINVNKSYNFNALQNLTITGFDSYSYDVLTGTSSLTIPYNTSSLTLNLESLTGAAMTVNGNAASGSYNVNITGDVTTINIVGTYGGYNTTHVLTVTRDLPKLENITFENGGSNQSHTFDYDQLTQAILFEVDSVTMNLTAANTVIKIDGLEASSKTFDLTSGDVDTVVEIISNDDASRKMTYNIKLSNDINSVSLSDLVWSGATVTGFDQRTLSYDLGTLAYDTNWSVGGTKLEGTSTVTYALNDGAYTSSLDFNVNKPLPSQSNTVKVKVTNTNSLEQIYTLTFVRDNGVDITQMDFINLINDVEQAPNSVNNLASSYDYDVDYDVTKLKLTPTIETAGGTVQYKIGSGDYDNTATKSLELGLNTILIKVTQGTEGQADHSSKIYTVNVTRHGSADVTNVSLALKDGSDTKQLYSAYAFNQNTHTYDVAISSDMTNLKIDVSRLDSSAVVSATSDIPGLVINGSVIETNQLAVGSYTVTIKVTTGIQGQSGYAQETYTYNINVIDGMALSEIYLKAGSDSILDLDPATLTYNLEVIAGISDLKFKAVRNNTTYTNMTLTYDGNVDESYDDGSEKTITFNTPEQLVLKVKSSIDELKTYTFNVTERAIDTDSTLNALSVSGYSLSPSFSSGTTSYSLNVSSGVSSVVVNGTKNSQYSSMTIAGDGVTSKSISLGVGSNNVPIVVTAENGTSTTYNLSIVRAEASSSSSGSSTGGSSGGSSGGFVPPPPSGPTPPAVEEPEDEIETIKNEDGSESTKVNVSEDRIDEDIKDDNKEKVTVIVEEGDATEVDFDETILESIKESEKPLEVTFKDVTFVLDKDVLAGLNVENKLNIVMAVSKETYEDTKIVSEVYELDLTDGEKKIDFDVPIPIVLTYDESQVKNKEDLAIYFYDEEAETWKYVGGKLEEGNRISFEAKHFSKYTIRENNKTFDDIQNHWAKEAIETLASREITSGVNAFDFAPDKTLTNAEFVVLLVKVLGLPESDEIMNFVNIHSGDWYEPFFKRAHGVDLLMGTYGVHMDPNAPIKREEMASLLMDAYFYYTNEDPDSLLLLAVQFAKDEELVSPHFRRDVRMTYQLELIVGDNQNNFNPLKGATRAEAAIVIRKLLILLNLI